MKTHFVKLLKKILYSKLFDFVAKPGNPCIIFKNIILKKGYHIDKVTKYVVARRIKYG